MKKLMFGALAGATLLAAQAASAETMQLKSAVYQDVEVVAADGSRQIQRVPAAKVVPGTAVTYVISYHNAGSEPASAVAITNPVPAQLEFVAASGAEPLVSVDGGNHYAALATLTVAAADGQLRPAQPADVTHVRWTLTAAVKPGAEGQVSYQAKLK